MGDWTDVGDSFRLPAAAPGRPDPDPCRECGTLIEPWWRTRPTPAWMRGPLVCRTCEDAARDAQVESDLSIRQHNADVPERFRPYRLDRVERMPAGADLSQWRLELGRMRPVAIGIHPGNVRAWQACCGYKPDSAGLWLHGPVGTGKTLLAAALATKLVAPWVPLTEEEIRKLAPKRVKYRLRRDVAPTAMCDVQDLLDRTRLSWSGDRDPLGRLSRIQVLILDDLGAVTLPEFGRDAIARVVDLRYRSRLPLIVTSNVEPEALHESLGERTASRLASLCRNVVPVRGPDFRTGGA